MRLGAESFEMKYKTSTSSKKKGAYVETYTVLLLLIF